MFILDEYMQEIFIGLNSFNRLKLLFSKYAMLEFLRKEIRLYE